MYKKTTRKVEISVKPAYLSDQSSPEEGHYVWSYNVNIQNNGSDPVQLISRHWKIMDEFGNMQEVKGDGVIGEQPVIDPGENFTYTSGTPLNTPSGIMSGSYNMISKSGPDCFDVEIPAFSLDSPYTKTTIN